jgi:hypothetical protein
MNKILISMLLGAAGFAGHLSIGLAGGGEYPDPGERISLSGLQNMVYGGEFFIQAEALPSVYIEPSVVYLNQFSRSATGLGLGINIRPRLGNFLLAPCLGLKGTLMLQNDKDLAQAIRDGQLNEYIETSNPYLSSTAYAGLCAFLGKRFSLDCNYRYLHLAPGCNIEMVWAGITYHINW